MAGKSPVTVDEEQRQGLLALSHSRDRGEADRARAIVLTLSGWTSAQIAQAFGVREDTVRVWRSAFMTGGIEALKKSVAPGPAPVKAERALAVAEEVLSGPVADRPNWTLPRLADEIERRAGVRRGAHLDLAAVRGAEEKGGFRWRRPRHTLKRRQDPNAVDRAGLRRKLLKAQAEAGDIVLLFGDESEALTHPYLAHVWAKKGADVRIPAPGQAAKVAMLGVLGSGCSSGRSASSLFTPAGPNEARTSSLSWRRSIGAMGPSSGLRSSPSCSSWTTARSTPARQAAPRSPSAPTGSPSSGCRTMLRS